MLASSRSATMLASESWPPLWASWDIPDMPVSPAAMLEVVSDDMLALSELWRPLHPATRSRMAAAAAAALRKVVLDTSPSLNRRPLGRFSQTSPPARNTKLRREKQDCLYLSTF